MSPRPFERANIRRRILLGAIFLVGIALRLFRLGADSLWYDETVSTYLAGSPIGELIRHTAGDIHPPGYYLLLRGWLLLTGYGSGRADPSGNGLEFAAAFFSLFFGVLLIALVYALARRFAGTATALVAAGLVALSPFNLWYSQEVRMYTLGAATGVIVLAALASALAQGTAGGRPRGSKTESTLGYTAQNLRGPGDLGGLDVSLSAEPVKVPWVTYAFAAAAGMYTLYYFAFLLLPLNLWALAVLVRQKQPVRPLILANVFAALLYAPWIPIAWRQATQPPVPPWRTAPDLWSALAEGWTALSFGQSMPSWAWPALVLTLALSVLGVLAIARGKSARENAGMSGAWSAVGLLLAVAGPFLLILLVSAVTPLYHVRYLFTYSPAFYVVLAAGLVGLAQFRRRAVRGTAVVRRIARVRGNATVKGIAPAWGTAMAWAAAIVWLATAGVTLHAFWFDPVYRADDHRAAVRGLSSRWRPGDVLLVNAGWPYTAVATYWDGAIAGRYRITGALPEARLDDALVMVTTGHVDGDAGLGWGEPRSDFFAMTGQVAKKQIADLFTRFDRVWHYRIYDTVNDPEGQVRGLLARYGQLVDDRTYAGEAFLRVERYTPLDGAGWNAQAPGAGYAGGLEARWEAPTAVVASGDRIYTAVTWRPSEAQRVTLGTSLRLVGTDSQTWAQVDEQPLGPLFDSARWPVGLAQRQALALQVPAGTPPGEYEAVLVAYAAASGQPLEPTPVNGAAVEPPGMILGRVSVERPLPAPEARPAVAKFGPLALIEARTPVTTLSPGDAIPVELLWQARSAPGEPLVVVIQLLDPAGNVAAGLEEQPLNGRYGAQSWEAGELVRDRHTLGAPPHLRAGAYRLVVGVYRAADGVRFAQAGGRSHGSLSAEIKTIEVR